jgi:lipid II:glycine glycyltransferase (peptidoglycan interpeptide bridge formation enzyme)
MLDLAPGPDALFRKFSQTRRNDIRRAIRNGISVDFASSREHVTAYYAVYVDWARRRRLQITGEEEFHEEFFTTRRNRRLLLARYNGEVIAGMVLRFLPGGVVEYAARSFLQSALHLKPNDLLHWRAIEWACAEGLTKYNLGGTGLFLRKFGGEVVPTTRHRLDMSLFRRHTVGDWMGGTVDEVRTFIPQRMVGLARALRSHVRKLRFYRERR